MRVIYDKPTPNIKLSAEKLKAFPPLLGDMFLQSFLSLSASIFYVETPSCPAYHYPIFLLEKQLLCSSVT